MHLVPFLAVALLAADPGPVAKKVPLPDAEFDSLAEPLRLLRRIGLRPPGEHRGQRPPVLVAAGALMMGRSPRTAFLQDYTREQEDRARRAVRDFLARHADPAPVANVPPPEQPVEDGKRDRTAS